MMLESLKRFIRCLIKRKPVPPKIKMKPQLVADERGRVRVAKVPVDAVK